MVKKRIFEIFEHHKFNLIFSLSEGECYCISKNINLFKSKKINATVADFRFVKLTTDKFKLMKLLKENNLNTGNFYKIDNFQDAERVLKILIIQIRKLFLNQEMEEVVVEC